MMRPNAALLYLLRHEAEYCDRISMMVDGEIKALDTVPELKKKYNAADMDEVFRKLARGALRTE